MLISAGANVNHERKDKATALHEAASHGQAEVCKLLLDFGCKLNHVDAKHRTALKLVRKEDAAVFAILANAGGKK